MQNRSAIFSSLVLGLLLIIFAVFIAWQFGSVQPYTITSIACIIAGGVCIVFSGIQYLRTADDEDYFHVE